MRISYFDNSIFRFRSKHRHAQYLDQQIAKGKCNIDVYPGYLIIELVEVTRSLPNLVFYKLNINPYLFGLILLNAKRSSRFRRIFLEFLRRKVFSDVAVISSRTTVITLIDFCLDWSAPHLMDMASNYLVLDKLYKRISLEECLAWLSTLGGGYSNLGQHKIEAAREAGKLALKEVKVAYRLNDPICVARCWIFIAESYAQCGMWRPARRIAKRQYKFWLTVRELDVRLGIQCQSVLFKVKALRKNINPYDYS